MISLAFVGFGMAGTADNHLQVDPDAGTWQQVKYQFSHAQWVGCSYWDMIQPSFMFMVGVSMAWSYAKRQRLGHSWFRMLAHAITRSVVLILLSIFLMSKSRSQTAWEFMNVLAQIGLGYTFLFLLWGKSVRVQAVVAVLVLGGTAALYEFWPNPGVDVSEGAAEVGVTAEWAKEHLTTIRPAWHKNANAGHAIDRWFLNLFPRTDSFEFNRGGYQTINFIPSLVTMLFGLMCGELLRLDWSAGRKLLILLLCGGAGLAAGWVLNEFGWCPLVKRIWTPSWALFSTGWCCFILGTLYAVIDVAGLRFWTLPLTVVGMNSIAIYCMSMTLKPFTARQLQIHFGDDVFTCYGRVDVAYSPTVQAVMVGCVFWLVCYYMYRNRMFVRI